MRRPETLLTYNIKFGEDLPGIFAWFQTLKIRPAFACFQEFPDPKQIGFGQELIKMGYAYKFADAIKKDGITFGQLTAVGPGLSIDSSHIVDFGFSLKERIYPGIKGRSGRRSALVTNVRTEDARTIQVANMHQPLIAFDIERLKNILQVEQSLDPHLPAIIAGDQNFSSFLRPIWKTWLIDEMEKIGFKDSGNQEPTFSWRGKRWTVDYISLRDKNLEDPRKLQNPRVERIGLSDHEPLFVDIV